MHVTFRKKLATCGRLLQPPRSLRSPRRVRSLRSKRFTNWHDKKLIVNRIYYCIINLLTIRTSPKVIKDTVACPAPPVPQVHPSSLLQLSELQAQTIELTSPMFSALQCTPNTVEGSQRLWTSIFSPVSVRITWSDIDYSVWNFAEKKKKNNFWLTYGLPNRDRLHFLHCIPWILRYHWRRYKLLIHLHKLGSLDEQSLKYNDVS